MRVNAIIIVTQPNSVSDVITVTIHMHVHVQERQVAFQHAQSSALWLLIFQQVFNVYKAV